MTKEEENRRKQCPYYWKKKGVAYGVCCASPHAHYSDEPCWMDDCFWMKEWIYENLGENDR